MDLRKLIEFMSTGGEVANAQVCKTCIRGFESRPVLQRHVRRKRTGSLQTLLSKRATILPATSVLTGQFRQEPNVYED
jgi:hypothetical protein